MDNIKNENQFINTNPILKAINIENKNLIKDNNNTKDNDNDSNVLEIYEKNLLTPEKN